MISIIIPIYNQADKLPRCLDSIIGQTEGNYEVIIVNDGSTDSLLKVLAKYPQFKVINQKNQGAPAARNRGAKEARGEYLFFCDADATLEANCLELMLKCLNNNPKAGYAYSSFLWGKKLFKVGPFSAEKLKSAPMIHTMSLIRRKAFPKSGWDESIKKLQDWDLYLTMLKEGQTGAWINQVLFTIQPGGSISSWLPALAYKILPFLKEVRKYKKAVAIVKEKHNLNKHQ